MDIKQFDSLKAECHYNPKVGIRQVTLPNGNIVSYDYDTLQQCVDLAPESAFLELADNFIVSMWDSYKAVSDYNIDMISAMLQSLNSSANNEKRLGFCKLIKDKNAKLSITVRDCESFDIDVNSQKVTFTTDLVDYVSLDEKLVFKTDDDYFLYSVSPETVILICYKVKIKDGMSYIKGFDDTIMSKEIKSTHLIQNYINGYPMYDNWQGARTYLRSRAKKRKIVSETLDYYDVIKDVTAIKPGPYLVQIDPKTNNNWMRCMYTNNIVRFRDNVRFSEDGKTAYQFDPRGSNGFHKFFYLYKIEDGIYYFIAKNAVHFSEKSKRGEMTCIEGYRMWDELLDTLNIPKYDVPW